jgi:hypothetical protein
MHTVGGPKKRGPDPSSPEEAEVPAELAPQFKFARQKPKLAGTIRGSCFGLQERVLAPDRLCEVQ